jgi:hypothetical protein
MADDVDKTEARSEKLLEASVALTRQAAAMPIPKSLVCLYCEEATTNGIRWCNSECRDLWEMQNKKRR